MCFWATRAQNRAPRAHSTKAPFSAPPSLNGPITWELLHAVHGAEVILEGAIAVDGHVQVELGHEGKERTRAVAMLNGPQADSKQPVNVLHLLLQREVGWTGTARLLLGGGVMGCSPVGMRKGLPGARRKGWTPGSGRGVQVGCDQALCWAGRTGHQPGEAALQPRPEACLHCFKVPKAVSERVPCDQNPVVGTLPRAERSAGASGDEAARKLRPQPSPGQQRSGPLGSVEAWMGRGGEGLPWWSSG